MISIQRWMGKTYLYGIDAVRQGDLHRNIHGPMIDFSSTGDGIPRNWWRWGLDKSAVCLRTRDWGNGRVEHPP